MAMAKQSRAEDIYEIIKNQILSGRWQAGDRLSDAELAEECQASRISVREALFKMTETGIVKKEFWKGYFINSITPETIENIVEMRLAIESQVIYTFTETATAEDLADLDACINLSEEYLHEGDLSQYLIADFNFHEIIYTRQRNSCFTSIMNNYLLMIHFIRYNAMGHGDSFTEKANKSIATHRYILEAIKARDKDEAKRRMVDHLHVHKEEAEQEMEARVYES